MLQVLQVAQISVVCTGWDKATVETAVSKVFQVRNSSFSGELNFSPLSFLSIIEF